MVWRESSAPASSLWRLEKHLGGYYTLIFNPSTVSACSLSLHTIKTTSLPQTHRAQRRKQSLVKYPHRDPLLLIFMNEMVLFCTSKGGPLFILAVTFCISLPQVFPCSVSMIS